MTSDERSNLNFCDFCGKLKRSGRKGTMTDWIFGGNNCRCDQSNAYQPIKREQSANAFSPSVEAANATNNASKMPELGNDLEILEFLGQGGMGTVWKALNKRTNKIYAVKVLKNELAQDEASVRRFEREVEAASQLTHPNLVFVYGSYRTVDNKPFMVMNYVDGASLNDVLSRGALSPRRALPIFEQIADALAHAHDQGIVHRDLKPSNILVYQHESKPDAIRLVDFGIAKLLSDMKNTNSLTQTGDLFGSPLYMSPEQCSGEELDARSDIYSFGCVMYQTLSGQPPFNDSNAIKTMVAHMQTPPPNIRRSKEQETIPKKLETVVMRCLEKNPANRYQTASALLKDLQAVKTDRNISKQTKKSFVDQIGMNWRVTAIVLASFAVGGFSSWVVMNMGSLKSSLESSVKKVAGIANSRSKEQVANTVAEIPAKTSLEFVTNEASTVRAVFLEAYRSKRSIVRIAGFNVTAKELECIRGDQYIEELDLASTELDGEALKVVSTLSNLRSLRLSKNHFGEEGLSMLPKLKLLSNLFLSDTDLTDSGMKYVAELKRLSHLEIARTKVSDAGLALLAPLRAIEKLDLSSTAITDKSLAMISRFPNLSDLSLADDAVTYKGLEELQQHDKKLTSLNLHGCSGIDEKAMNTIVKCNNLVRFSSGLDCTDELTKVLARKSNWTSLMLDGRLSVKTFQYLMSQKHLKGLCVCGFQNSSAPEGFAFRNAHPDCVLDSDEIGTARKIQLQKGPNPSHYFGLFDDPKLNSG